MKNKKWYMMLMILILTALASLYAKGRLIGGEVTVVPVSDSPRRVVSEKGLPSLSGLVKDTKPSVVNISTTTLVKGIDMPARFGNPFKDFFGDDFFDKFFGGDAPTREFKQKSLGSGFVIDKEGYILTNNHVVEKASSIKVKLSDGKEYDAKVMGKDAKTDIALIKVNAKNSLPVAVLGDSGKLEVGDWVVAVGNPFGLDHTVTAGIVSAKGRVIGQGPYDDFIQTDASINPGNSGGPLFNLKGEVVGINTAIVSGGQGIGFAIPINIARVLLPQLKSKGKVVRGWLGVVIQKVTPELAKSFELKESEGALVSDVMDNSPASKADIRRGDVIISFDGKPIKEMDQLPRIVAGTEIGKKVRIGLIRDGKPKNVEVAITEGTDETVQEQNTPEVEKNFGLVVQNITPEIARHLNLKDKRGVIVTDIQNGSAAEEADIRAGDIIKEINKKIVKNVDDFKEILKKARPREGIVMLVKRENMTFYAVVREGKSQ
ncbi:MAG: putative periplasmic serine endoprotease DegP-like precursor [Syntrophorhabdaceae bacterium PtaU1.Bin034]|nr:MAG: putative periplasmic serine endoprotease DegP-like precursor [Syntrophorhabdaceae bacterium PtaU1.Bin034]